ncbi:MAG: Acyltransferase family protein [Tardiphaga sp.]|nr:Acyltransferase family protein [Tardiphaga sp.]
MAARITALDRARTLITLLVLVHHSVLNFTYFGNGDKARWLGFDLVVLFNDSFFMAAMFLISGLFVWSELGRKRPARFLRDRAWRLGIPFLISIFVLMPIAYYPTFLRYHAPGTTDFSLLHFWWRTMAVGPWPSGPAWFLWVLLAFDALAALLWIAAPRVVGRGARAIAALRDRPGIAVAGFVVLTIVAYVPLRIAVGDAAWLAFGPIPIQTSRILLYASSFVVGLLIGASDLRSGLLDGRGAFTRHWPRWLGIALIGYAGILALVYVKRGVLPDPNVLPSWFEAAYAIAFAVFSAAMACALIAAMLRFAATRLTLLDTLRPSAYGVYLVHYIFIIWLQYAVFDLALSPFAKFAIVFAGTLAGSWIVVAMARRLQVVRRLI